MVKYRHCECGRGILKEVCERVTEQGVWKITTDQKLKEYYKTPDLVPNIKRDILSEWGLWSEWTKQVWQKISWPANKKVGGNRKSETEVAGR